MRIKCINAGNFANLTLEKEYEVIRESRDLYTVSNDVDIEANYHKRFFEVVAEQPATPPPLAPMNVRVVRNNESNMTIFISTGPANNREEHSTHIIGNNIAGNCGIMGFNGINDVMFLINNPNEGYYYTENNIKLIIEQILEQCHLAITVFSTNNDYPLLWNVLDSICDFCSESRNNPNSDNNIKLWGFHTVEE